MAEVRLMDILLYPQSIAGCFIPTDIQLLVTCKRPATGWLVVARVQTEKQDKCHIFGIFEITFEILYPF